MSVVHAEAEVRSRKRKHSGGESEDRSVASDVVVECTREKRSRLAVAGSTAKESIKAGFAWFLAKSKSTFSRSTLTSPFLYMNKAWEDLSTSIGASYEQYQGPVLEGPELIASVPTMVPISNLALTTATVMPPPHCVPGAPTLSTNTTFMNLAPQPSLSSFVGAAQLQAGKYASLPRGPTFAPNGFSTPIMAATTQTKFSRSGTPNLNGYSQFKSHLHDRTPLKLKKTSQESTHDKLFANGKFAVSSSRKITLLLDPPPRRPRGDSPSVGNGFPLVFKNLMRKQRAKPYAAAQSINLQEKMKYRELLVSHGIKSIPCVSQSSASSVSSHEQRSRSSSVLTIGSQNSRSSHSPPLSSLPFNVPWKPVTPGGSKLRPIVLTDDPQKHSASSSPEILREVAISSTNTSDELEKENKEETSKTISSVAEPEVLSFAESDVLTSPQPEVVSLDETLPQPEVLPPPESSTSTVDLIPAAETNDDFVVKAPSKPNAAFIVEKEMRSPRVVDLTDEANTTPDDSLTKFEKKVSVRRISVSNEPAFMVSARESPYTDKNWLQKIKHNSLVDKNKNKEIEAEQKAYLEVYRQEREKAEEDLVERLNVKLTLAKRIPAAVEEVFIESSEDESEEEEEDKEFPELTDEMEDRVADATVPHPPMEVLSSAFKLDITRKDMRTLVGLEWLNDEIINFYMNMLVDRGEKSENALPKVYTFNTFFYPTLIKDGYTRLKRWTRRVDLFSYDLVLVPVHLQMHWCLAVIDFQNKQILYFDSMGGNNQKCLSALKSYLVEEHQDKKKSPFDLSDWRAECVKDIPQQMNGSDCGMFTCKYAEYVTRRAPITFTQGHMPYFRKRMVYEILTLQLM